MMLGAQPLVRVHKTFIAQQIAYQRNPHNAATNPTATAHLKTRRGEQDPIAEEAYDNWIDNDDVRNYLEEHQN